MILPWWQGLGDRLEHVRQQVVVHVLVRDERGDIILTLGHLRPVQSPAGIPRYQRPEHALGTAVALTEGMQGVEIIIIGGQTFYESVSIQALQHMIMLQRHLGVLSACGEQLQGLEDAAPTLAHVNGADPSHPLIHILEEIMMDPLQLADRTLRGQGHDAEFAVTDIDQITLSVSQRLPATGTHPVAQHAGARNQIRVNARITGHAVSNPYRTRVR